jgi:hypothetical protein
MSSWSPVRRFAVQLFFGTVYGLTATRSQAWYQGGGIVELEQSADSFGYARAPLYLECSLIFADGFATGTTAARSAVAP